MKKKVVTHVHFHGTRDAGWEENKHPRNHGQFSSSPGAKGAGLKLQNRRAEAQKLPHHAMAEKAGWKYAGTHMLGVAPQRQSSQHIYKHPDRPDERVEVHHNEGVGTSWGHRTPASGAGTGVRPVGGTSHTSMGKHLKRVTPSSKSSGGNVESGKNSASVLRDLHTYAKNLAQGSAMLKPGEKPHAAAAAARKQANQHLENVRQHLPEGHAARNGAERTHAAMMKTLSKVSDPEASARGKELAKSISQGIAHHNTLMKAGYKHKGESGKTGIYEHTDTGHRVEVGPDTNKAQLRAAIESGKKKD